MLDVKTKVHNQKGGASADSGLVMQKHFLFLDVNELVKELRSSNKIVCILCLEAIRDLATRISRDSSGVEHVADIGRVDLSLA